MIEAAISSVNLRKLEQRLQESLQLASLPRVPLQVGCFLRRETLTVLVHCPASMMPDSQKIFPPLRQALENEPRVENYRVLMYLLVGGHQQSEPGYLTIEPAVREEAVPATWLLQSMTSEWEGGINLLPQDREKIRKSKLCSASLVAASSIGAAMLFMLAYAWTRPCVMGKCLAIPQAKELAQKSATIFQQPPSALEIPTAREQLAQSIGILQTIPPWSSYHSEAESLASTYQARLASLEEAIAALNKGNQAVSMAQSTPLTLSQWQQTRKLWQGAIAHWANLPADSEYYPFAQRKIQDYRQNLAVIDRRLKEEREAINNLKAAQEAAKLGEVRQSVAQSLSNWQLVAATWQSAIERLDAIAQGTTVCGEGRQLLKSYLPNLIAAKEHKNQEQFALDIYNQAIRQAGEAKKSESDNQWSAAVAHWRKSLTDLKQVPDNTFQYRQVYPLIDAHTKALEKAQDKLRVALKLQQARSNLEKTCSQTNQVCNYTINSSNITVHLTPTYTQKVWQTALQAKAEGNVQAQVQLLNQISTLEKNLETISQKSGMPVEVYQSDGSLIATYLPAVIP